MNDTIKKSSAKKREYTAPEAEVVHLGTSDVLGESIGGEYTSPFGDKGGEGPATW